MWYYQLSQRYWPWEAELIGCGFHWKSCISWISRIYFKKTEYRHLFENKSLVNTFLDLKIKPKVTNHLPRNIRSSSVVYMLVCRQQNLSRLVEEDFLERKNSFHNHVIWAPGFSEKKQNKKNHQADVCQGFQYRILLLDHISKLITESSPIHLNQPYMYMSQCW